MATAEIKLEFKPGDDIMDAFTEAIRIAKQLNCFTSFTFNGVTCLADPEGIAEKGVKMYRDQLKSKSTIKVAIT